jgi:Glycosyltransferase involved in LPS biosynthesis
MKVLLINLDRATDRLERMRRVFGEAGIEFERVSGVDGSQLSGEELERCQPQPVYFGWLAKGELGCFLSHRLCWKRIAEGPHEHVAVFEDDIVFGSDAAALLADTQWVPADADIVKLDAAPFRTYIGRDGKDLPGGRRLHRLCFNHYCTGGYIISKRAAAYLLKESEILRAPVDEFMFNVVSPAFRRSRVYQVVPALCTQERYVFPQNDGEPGSYIEGRQFKRRLRLGRKLIRELYSGFNRVCSWFGLRQRRKIGFDLPYL